MHVMVRKFIDVIRSECIEALVCSEFTMDVVGPKYWDQMRTAKDSVNMND